MLEVLVFGLLAGLDNLQVSASLALLPISRRRLILLAAAFALSEILAAVLGLLLGRGLIVSLGQTFAGLAPFAMLLCGVIVFLLALRQREGNLEQLVNQPALLVGLPLSLSIDNIIAGAGLSFSSSPLVSSALIIGVVSGSMACAGLFLGRIVRRFLPDRVELAVGLYLCFLAVRSYLEQG